MKKENFEIHIGFPEGYEEYSCKLDNNWTKLNVNRVLAVDDLDEENCFQEHNVPGTFSALYTHRYASIDEAIENVNKLGDQFSGMPDIRFELEEVLHTSSSLVDLSMKPFTPFIAEQSGFEKLLLIHDAPKFEMHFSINKENDQDILINEEDIIEMALSVGVGLHEVVCFDNKRKITTTTFFRSYDEMKERFPVMCNKFHEALEKKDHNSSIKQIAERIIFCARPI